jgi:hypothetical protein
MRWLYMQQVDHSHFLSFQKYGTHEQEQQQHGLAAGHTSIVTAWG